MSSPRSVSTCSTTTTTTASTHHSGGHARTHHPSRNKSSTNLAAATGQHQSQSSSTKPKRNKSSSSLSSHHHNVSFTHHGNPKKSSSSSSSSAAGHKRTGSSSGGSSRKGAFDFGFTKMEEPVIATAAIVVVTSPSALNSESDSDDDDEEDNREIDVAGAGATREEEEGEGEEEEEEEAGGSTSRGREKSRSRSRDQGGDRSLSRERDRVREREADISRERSRSAARERLRKKLAVNTSGLGTRKAALELVTAGSDTSNNSEWLSATDSPAPKLQSLRLGGIVGAGIGESGLSQLLLPLVVLPTATAKEASVEVLDTTLMLPPLTRRGNGGAGGAGRATFQLIDDPGNGTPPSPQSFVNPPPLLQRHSSGRPRPASPPLHSIPSPVNQSLTPQFPPSTPNRSSIPFPSSSSSTVIPSSTSTVTAAAALAAPSTGQRSTSPALPRLTSALQHRPPNAQRKSSTASLLSIKSNVSFVNGLMGPPAPPSTSTTSATGFRRTGSSAVAPVIDRGVFGVATLSSPGSAAGYDAVGDEDDVPVERGAGRMLSKHSRSDSVTSLRSIAESPMMMSSAARPDLKRASTMGANEARDMGRRLRESTAGGGGGAMAALSNASSMGDLRHSGRRSASGYFGTLRDLALVAVGAVTTGGSPNGVPYSPGLRSPRDQRSFLPTSTSSASLSNYSAYESARSRLLSATSYSGSAAAAAAAGHHAVPASSPLFASQPLVSKFVEPLDPTSLAYLATPPTALRALPPHATYVSSALALDHGHGGVMSRTQQKMMLQRDAPYGSEEGSSSGTSDGGGNNGGSYYYTQAPSSAALPTISSLSPTAAAGKRPSSSLSSSTTTAGTIVGLTSAMTTTSGSNNDTPRSIGMQKWAAGLIREAERIERSAKAVERWRDPIGDSLVRVLAAVR